MTKEVALKILERHNEWRRGKEIPMLKPELIGIAVDKAIEVLRLSIVSGSASVDLDKQVEVLKKTIDKLMITFDDESDRMDYILDIVNEYKRQMLEHYR